MQTDLDGKQTYSDTRSVNLGNASSGVTIYPNPAINTIMIVFPTGGEYEVTLLNSNGQMINSPVLSTGNNLVVNVSNRKAGTYFIRIKHETITETRKLIIRK
jgi:hypothetical protein